MNSKNVYAKAVNVRGSILVYYECDRKTLRWKTGITQIPKDDQYFKNGKLTAIVNDYKKGNEEIEIELEKINCIIREYYFAKKEKPSVDYVKSEMAKNKQILIPDNKKFESFEDYYNLMYEEKTKEAIAPSSLKDYKSTFNSLKLYQHLHGHLSFDIMNSEDFLKKFETFLRKKHYY